MLKPTENPPIKPADVSDLRELSGEWWVAHTKSRNEKALAWDLLRKKIPYFLPMVPKVTFSGGRKRRNMHPLFTGYVFFNGSVDDRYAAFNTDRVANVIQAQDQTLLRRELFALDRVLLSTAAVDAYPELYEGRRVRVKAGELEGVIGVVRNRDDVTLLVISVSILGQSAELRVEPELLEPYDD